MKCLTRKTRGIGTLLLIAPTADRDIQLSVRCLMIVLKQQCKPLQCVRPVSMSMMTSIIAVITRNPMLVQNADPN